METDVIKRLVRLVAKVTKADLISQFTDFLVQKNVLGLKHEKSVSSKVLYKWDFLGHNNLTITVLLQRMSYRPWVVQYKNLSRYYKNTISETESIITTLLEGPPPIIKPPTADRPPARINQNDPRVMQVWKDLMELHQYRWRQTADIKQQWALAVKEFKDMCRVRGLKPFKAN